MKRKNWRTEKEIKACSTVHKGPEEYEAYSEMQELRFLPDSRHPVMQIITMGGPRIREYGL